MYYCGRGVTRDYKEAFTWSLKAAEKGSRYAQRLLGDMYYYGNDVVTKSYQDALKWYLKAAKNGHVESQKMVWQFAYSDSKELVEKHQEILQSYKKLFLGNDDNRSDADIYFEIGSKCNKYNSWFYSGIDADRKYFKTDDADTVSLQWYLLAANQGSIAAQIKLAEIYYDGEDGVEEDTKKAHEWYLKAAELGNVFAQYKVGKMCYKGEGTAQDYKKAFTSYLQAAKLGNAGAQNDLGCMYYDGTGIAQDYKKALEWYLQAAELGNISAQYNLGHMYYSGTGTAQDYKKSFKWYLKAANHGIAKAQSFLGNILLKGADDIACDEKQALLWLKKEIDTQKMGWNFAYSDIKELTENHQNALQEYKRNFLSVDDARSDAEIYFEIYSKYRKYNDCVYWRYTLKDNEDDSYPCWVNDLEYKYFQLRENFDKIVLQWCLLAAQHGSAVAQFDLAPVYFYGYAECDVVKDRKQSLIWLKKAAENGYVEAQRMAWQFTYGDIKELTENHQKALQAYKESFLSADDVRSNADIYFEIYSKYRKYNYHSYWRYDLKYNEDDSYLCWGNDLECEYFTVEESLDKIILQWCLQAAEQGSVAAQFELAIIFLNGECDVAEDRKQALVWLKKAAINDPTKAQKIIADMGSKEPDWIKLLIKSKCIGTDYLERTIQDDKPDAELIKILLENGLRTENIACIKYLQESEDPLLRKYGNEFASISTANVVEQKLDKDLQALVQQVDKKNSKDTKKSKEVIAMEKTCVTLREEQQKIQATLGDLKELRSVDQKMLIECTSNMQALLGCVKDLKIMLAENNKSHKQQFLVLEENMLKKQEARQLLTEQVKSKLVLQVFEDRFSECGKLLQNRISQDYHSKQKDKYIRRIATDDNLFPYYHCMQEIINATFMAISGINAGYLKNNKGHISEVPGIVIESVFNRIPLLDKIGQLVAIILRGPGKLRNQQIFKRLANLFSSVSQCNQLVENLAIELTLYNADEILRMSEKNIGNKLKNTGAALFNTVGRLNMFTAYNTQVKSLAAKHGEQILLAIFKHELKISSCRNANALLDSMVKVITSNDYALQYINFDIKELDEIENLLRADKLAQHIVCSLQQSNCLQPQGTMSWFVADALQKSLAMMNLTKSDVIEAKITKYLQGQLSSSNNRSQVACLEAIYVAVTLCKLNENQLEILNNLTYRLVDNVLGVDVVQFKNVLYKIFAQQQLRNLLFSVNDADIKYDSEDLVKLLQKNNTWYTVDTKKIHEKNLTVLFSKYFKQKLPILMKQQQNILNYKKQNVSQNISFDL